MIPPLLSGWRRTRKSCWPGTDKYGEIRAKKNTLRAGDERTAAERARLAAPGDRARRHGADGVSDGFRMARPGGRRMRGRERLRRRPRERVGEALRPADVVLGIFDIRGGRFDRFHQARLAALESRVRRGVFRLALQRISYEHLAARAPCRVSVLPHFARVDGGDLRADDLSAALGHAPFFVDSLDSDDAFRRGRRHPAAPP